MTSATVFESVTGFFFHKIFILATGIDEDVEYDCFRSKILVLEGSILDRGMVGEPAFMGLSVIFMLPDDALDVDVAVELLGLGR